MEMINVMTTETWAYFRSQLDRSRKIKIHILRPLSDQSYCGLQNHEDTGQMLLHLIPGEDLCKKCFHAYIISTP